MTVWIVNPYDNLPTEGNRPQRYCLMARAFVRAGHKVVYWTSDFSHATKRKRVSTRQVDDGFEVKQIPTLPYKKNICIRRMLSHGRLAKDWLRLVLLEDASPDVVIASTPPLSICDSVRKYARNVGALFVADIQDAWPETFERVLPKTILACLGLYRKAKRIYREADAVSAVAMRYVELAQKYGSDASAMVFGHCINMATKANKAKSPNSVLRLVYVGNMSLSYDLETVINAIANMEGVSLDIAGNGPDKERLERISDGAGNIKFHGYLNESNLQALLASCDVGLIPMFQDSCVGIPGKIADYAAAGLKIIESLGGETAELVDRYIVGCHYKAGNMESLQQAIAAIRSQVATPNSSEFASQFDADAIMSDYVKWVEGLYQCCKDWGCTRGPHIV